MPRHVIPIVLGAIFGINCDLQPSQHVSSVLLLIVVPSISLACLIRFCRRSVQRGMHILDAEVTAAYM